MTDYSKLEHASQDAVVTSNIHSFLTPAAESCKGGQNVKGSERGLLEGANEWMAHYLSLQNLNHAGKNVFILWT